MLLVDHWFVWGVAFLIIFLVAVTDHEGRPEEAGGDKDSTLGMPSEGLQWCWIRGGSVEDQFLWELVGGKLVEWGSCLFITVVYVFIIRRLWHMNLAHARGHTSSCSYGDARAGSSSSSPLLGTAGGLSGLVEGEEGEEEGCPAGGDSDDESQSSAGLTGVDTVSLRSGARPHLCSSDSDAGDCSDADSGSAASNQDLVVSEVSGRLTPSALTLQNTEQNAAGDAASRDRAGWRLDKLLAAFGRPSNQEDDVAPAGSGAYYAGSSGAAGSAAAPSRDSASASAGGGAVAGNNGYFNKFFLQMSIVPCLFFFARFWGSLRVVLQYANPGLLDRVPFIGYMQAVMDPAQGFCNFLLFVMTSEEERRGVWRNMGAGAAYLGASAHHLGEQHVPGFTRGVEWLCCLCAASDRRCRLGARGSSTRPDGKDHGTDKDQSYVSVTIGEDEEDVQSTV